MTKSIAMALVTAQLEMTKAQKKANNPHFRTKYADLGNVMDACMPALNAAGIAVIQPAGENEGGRYIETIFIHGESGEELGCKVPLIVCKSDMQGYGSAVTYARRYGLMTMAGIATEDDDGNAAAKAPPPKQQQQAPAPFKPSMDAVDKASDAEVMTAVKHLTDCPDLPTLKLLYVGLAKDMPHIASDKRVVKAKDSRKDELSQ